MPLSDIVDIQITSNSVGVTQAGFGIPLIASFSAAWVERVRFYASLDAVSADFAATTVEYLAAQAMFSQNPAPSTIAIGRCANKPTQKYKLTVATTANSTAYKVRARIGGAATNVTVTATSDANATIEEICDLLVTALNGVAAKNYTAARVGNGNASTVEATADAAGTWFSLEVLDVNLLSIEQTHSDPGIAADLTAIKLASSNWYALATTHNSKGLVLAAAAWVESNEKLYAVSIADTATITAAAGGTDTADDLKDSAYARTAAIYHPAPDAFADAAWLGKCLPFDPGSETWKFKTLAGVPTVTLTATHQTNLEAKRCNYYYTVAGVNMTTQGVVAAGEYIDVVRFRDWLRARIMERVFALLAGAKKVPFTDPGVALVEAELRAQLQEGVDVGGLSADPAPTVTVPKVASVSNANKTARLLPSVTFAATLAGAIHKVQIRGTVSV